MSTTEPKVDGSRPWCFEVADETRREIVADVNGLRRAANRAVGTVDAIAHRFVSASAERRMADEVLGQVRILRVLAYGWAPLRSDEPFDDIEDGVGLVDTEGITIQASVYSRDYFRAEVHGRVYIMHRELSLINI
jgi:hypothetical protein